MVDQIPRDSPTMSKLVRFWYFNMLPVWDGTFTVSTSRLRSWEVPNSNHDCWAWNHLKEMRAKMRLKQNEIVQWLKGAYGRVDAPFLWFSRTQTKPRILRILFCPFDPCCFVLRNENQQPEGIIGIHVDGGLCCGSTKFHAKLCRPWKKISIW